jgi:HSF-type DNA-binding
MEASSNAEFENLFPAKLHYVLDEAEKDGEGRGGVIAWLPHGKAFLVKDRAAFVRDFLPKYVTFSQQVGRRNILVPVRVSLVVTHLRSFLTPSLL